MQARKGSRVLPECQSIACMGFQYVLMRECKATAGLAIYNARPIGEVSKLSSLAAGFKLHLHRAAEGVDNV